MLIDKKEEIGELIKDKRVDQHYTQASLAKALSVSRYSVVSWENGTSKPTEENLAAIVELLGIDPHEVELEKDRVSYLLQHREEGKRRKERKQDGFPEREGEEYDASFVPDPFMLNGKLQDLIKKAMYLREIEDVETFLAILEGGKKKIARVKKQLEEKSKEEGITS